MKDQICISIREYERLIERDKMLSQLENYGVDNWAGYGDAMAELREDMEDDLDD